MQIFKTPDEILKWIETRRGSSLFVLTLTLKIYENSLRSRIYIFDWLVIMISIDGTLLRLYIYQNLPQKLFSFVHNKNSPKTFWTHHVI
jgi:hypothetical protein